MTTIRITCVLVLAASSVALADPKQEAERHIANATRAHEANNYEQALAELTAAHELDPRPELLYAIGQVGVKLGRCDAARASYEKFLAVTKDPQARPLVEQALAACVPAAEPPPPAKKEKEKEKQRRDEPVPAPVVRTRKPFYKDVLGDVLVVAGVASAVAGLAVYSGARADLDSAKTAPDLATYNDLIDGASGKRSMSVALIGGGVALVGAGVVSYLVRDRTEVRRGGIAVAPHHGGGFITWLGRF